MGKERQSPIAPRIQLISLPQIQMSNKASTDLIDTDLRDIPRVSSTVTHEFRQEPDSLNCQSLINFLNPFGLIALNARQTGQRSPFVDVYIIGEEKSLNGGELLTQLSNIALPLLNVEIRSSDEVLHDLNHDKSRLNLGPNSLVIGITQSWETYSTKNCIEIFNEFCRQGKIKEVFVITGNLIDLPFRKEIYQHATTQQHSRILRHNHFDNCSERNGKRRAAEPATLTTMATIQVLIEIFLAMLRHPHSSYLGNNLSQKDIDYLEKCSGDEFINIAMQIVGANLSGEKIKSKINKTLVNNGHKLAQNILETPTVWGIHSAYIAFTVAFTGPLFQTILDLIINNKFLSDISGNLDLSLLLAILEHGAISGDITLYIFGPWLWTLLLRYSQGRQMLARIGQRTIVIVDVQHWVHALTKSYANKLYANSFGITSPEFHGVNLVGLLHNQLPRTSRGRILIVGIPDGMGSLELKALEDNAIRAAVQASGIQNLGAGAEITVIDTNPRIEREGFSKSIVLSVMSKDTNLNNSSVSDRAKLLAEILYGARVRLLANQVLLHASVKKVAAFPLLEFEFWNTQSGTLVMPNGGPTIRTKPSHVDSSYLEAQREQD